MERSGYATSVASSLLGVLSDSNWFKSIQSSTFDSLAHSNSALALLILKIKQLPREEHIIIAIRFMG